ncbi:MAG: family ATPase [Crocinitomicaceae bacterium]|jgi:superfamily I DNA and/or RNA helicase|nr:family ATPase [Crocinitomicaceae bacterium]
MEKREQEIARLLHCIDLEDKEQEKRYSLDQQHSLKQLKAEGVALHPINIVQKTFGFADYPEISFRLPYSCDTGLFKDNSAIECFLEGEAPVKGILLGIDGQKGEFRLFAPDFPDWIEEKGVGIKLSPDQHTSECMKSGLQQMEKNPYLLKLFGEIHGEEAFGETEEKLPGLEFQNPELNASQQKAIQSIVASGYLSLVHGPPGTGKSTTLCEAIVQLLKKGERILLSAPSNTAIDHLAKSLLKSKVKILRVGNSLKIDEEILPFTLEGKIQEAKEFKEIKKLKIRAEELRKMAFQYKRRFGKDEREQRGLLLREVKSIRQEIRKIREHFNSTLYGQAEVILGTPVGLYDFLPKHASFDTLVIDEAGQMLEPLAWMIFPFAPKWVLAGDPLQLPPTVLSSEAARAGFSVSILERAVQQCRSVYFLDTQYRMRESIAAFSSRYFYKGLLLSPEHKANTGEHILFYDTAGTGFEEESGEDGMSLINRGEAELVGRLIDPESDLSHIAVISPYAAQVELLRKELPKALRIRTIDSFQGQEMEQVIISLVRSNSEATIGFLSDYRRMNVALTRAKEQLIVIGDSSTIGTDPFYNDFLTYVEEINGYRSAWELIS